MNVVLLHFPEEERRLGPLRSLAIPRLLLVSDGATPPACPDALEDWIWNSAPVEDRAQRAAVLEHRAEHRARTPRLDENGLLHFDGRWVPLSPTETVVAAQLITRFDCLVERSEVARAVWPNGCPRARTIDMHMHKLRRRVTEVGIEIETVRSRGWLMRASDRDRSNELVGVS
jgi:hypothetical protein